MKISGLQKLTLLDFPGRVAAIVFLGSCNFRCPFCQNSPLVLTPDLIPEISMDEFLGFLKKRSGMLDGICITGGEPTLYPDLPEFLSAIKSAGYETKLDTNGSNPEMLEQILSAKLADYVAMDIKAGPSNYLRVCGLTNDKSNYLDKINHSVQLLLSNCSEYEFRTTAVKGLHTEKDFREIASWISGCCHYYLQTFRDCPEVLQQNHPFSSFTETEMKYYLSILQKEIPQAALRGI